MILTEGIGEPTYGLSLLPHLGGGVWEAWFDGSFTGHLGLYCGDFLVVTILLCV